MCVYDREKHGKKGVGEGKKVNISRRKTPEAPTQLDTLAGCAAGGAGEGGGESGA